ncbi:hypothetical protein KQI84_11440 [bacterium]|nr:hypothetical protein [bacterium]
MTRLLVLGIGPHPLEANAAISGPTIRLRQFIEPLVEDGHEVHAALLEPAARRSVNLPDVARAAAFTPDQLCDPVEVLRGLGDAKYDAVLGVGSIMPVAAGTRVARKVGCPSWVDLFGDPLAEWHGDVCRPGEPNYIARDQIWKFLRESLMAGDAFSAVSDHQRDAILGQLTLLGRISAPGPLHHRIETIPVGVPREWSFGYAVQPFPKALRDRGIVSGTPYVFLGGSWTPWMKEGAMGRALRRLLEVNDRVRIVIRGGVEDGSSKAVADRFFEQLGDVPPKRVVRLEPGEGSEAAILAHAGTALLLDRDIPESYLGSRNRLLSWIRWGIRPIVSPRSMLAQELVTEGLAGGVDPDNVEEIVAEMRHSLRATALDRNRLARQGCAWLGGCTFHETLRPVLDWVENPQHFPADKGDGLLPRWANLPAEPERLF